jgi:MoaA/NifB/PqqE/SkfB family radical SAM enzyme
LKKTRGFWKNRRDILKIYRYKYLWMTGNPASTRAPVALNIEPTNRCNLRCKFCSIDSGREFGDMDWDFFKSKVDEAAEIGVVSINLYLSGEPLLHPRIADMVAYVSEKGLFSYLHTNATPLTRKTAAALIDAGLDSISFSFDGEDKETYEAHRIGAKYERTLENIRGFLEEKKNRGASRPHARIQIIRDMERFDESRITYSPGEDFKALFEGLPLDGFHQITPFNLRGEKEELALPRRKNYFPCFQLWAGMSVSWNGRVAGCCADLNARCIIGDLNTQSILDVWNSEELRRMRELLIKREYGKVPLCARCSYLWTNDAAGFRPWPFIKSLSVDLLRGR